MRNIGPVALVIALVCSTCGKGADTGPCETIYLCAVDECGALLAAEPKTQCTLDCEDAEEELLAECEQQVAPCVAACEADPPADVEPDDLEAHCMNECDEMRNECGAPAIECFQACPDPEWLTCAKACGGQSTDAPSTPGEYALIAFACDPAQDYCTEAREECQQE